MYRNLALSIGALVLAVLPLVSATASTSCPQHYLGGLAPDISNPRMAERAREVCLSEYALMHSGLTRTPLYAVERLTRERIAAARDMERENAFHEDESGRIPPGERSSLRDYARSGYDRGHVAPSGNMSNARSQQESFTMANMIPQDPDNNRKLWAAIESATRNLASRHGEVWVVSGPVFQGDRIAFLNNRVAIPTHVFKAVYVPSLGAGAVYVAANAPGTAWQAMSISQASRMTGFDIFPALPAEVKDRAMELPSPSAPRGGRRTSDAGQSPQAQGGMAAVAGWAARSLGR